jgi:catechol 2,3-dioxygenase-like lactoylglutathione lyase family enzyme
MMLGKHDVVATIAVRDLDTARRFYGEVLGLTQVDAQGEEVAVYQAGAARLNVYRSEFAGTNKATAATWDVGQELDAIVADLKAKGVSFEHYDMPGLELQGDTHVGYGLKIAWFTDPDGNILNLFGQ